MNIRYTKLLIILCIGVSLASSAVADISTDLYLYTNRVNISMSSTLEVYDAGGAFYGTISGTLTVQGGSAFGLYNFNNIADTGTYYFALVGSNGHRYWTNAQAVTVDGANAEVTVGTNGNTIAFEAFPNATPPFTVTEQALVGNHSISGYLDVQGQMIKLGTSPINQTEAAFTLTVEPTGQGEIIGDHMVLDSVRQISRAGTARAEWSWQNGSGEGIMSLSSSPYGNQLWIGGPLYTNEGKVMSLAGNDFHFSSLANHTIMIDQNSGAGRSLTIQAGNSSGTNQTGGNLILTTGNSTGSAGGMIEFKTATSGGTSGATSRPAATRMRINALGGIEAGADIVASAAPQFVAGKYNDTRTNDNGTNHTEGLFIVGNGTGTGGTPRTNALRILEDGTVLIQPKGDISMGGFQAGRKP